MRQLKVKAGCPEFRRCTKNCKSALYIMSKEKLKN